MSDPVYPLPLFFLCACESACIATRNTSCNNAGRAARSVAGRSLREFLFFFACGTRTDQQAAVAKALARPKSEVHDNHPIRPRRRLREVGSRSLPAFFSITPGFVDLLKNGTQPLRDFPHRIMRLHL